MCGCQLSCQIDACSLNGIKHSANRRRAATVSLYSRLSIIRHPLGCAGGDVLSRGDGLSKMTKLLVSTSVLFIPHDTSRPETTLTMDPPEVFSRSPDFFLTSCFAVYENIIKGGGIFPPDKRIFKIGSKGYKGYKG